MAFPPSRTMTRDRPRGNRNVSPERRQLRMPRFSRRSFSNLSEISMASNQPTIGDSSEVDLSAQAPVQGLKEVPTPPPVKRPTVFYPGTRLSSSRRTYTIRKRSQSQGISTDSLPRHRSSPSDSEDDSSVLSASTSATTIASDSETPKNTRENRLQQRPGSSQQLARPSEQTGITVKTANRTLHIEVPTLLPQHQENEQYRKKVEEVLLDKIENLKQETETLLEQRTNSSKELETTLEQLSSLNLDRDKAEKERGKERNKERERVEHLLQDLSDHKKLADDLKSQVSNFSDSLVGAQTERDEERGLREGLSLDLDETKRLLDEKTSLLDGLKIQVSEAAQTLVEILSERDVLKTSFEDADAERNKLSRELAQVQQEKADKEAYFLDRITGAEIARDAFQIQVDTLLTEKATHDLRLGELTADHDKLKAESDPLTEQLRMLIEEKEVLDGDKRDLQVQVDGLEEDKQGLSTQIAGLEEETTTMLSLIERLEGEKKDLQDKLSGFEEEKGMFQSDIDELRRAKEELEGRLATVVEEKGLTQILVASLEGEKRNLETRLEALEGESVDTKAEVELLQREKKGLNIQLESISTEKQDLLDEVDKLKEDDSETKPTIENLQAEKAEQQSQITRMSADHNALLEETTSLKTQVLEHTVEITRLKSDITTSEAEVTKLQTETQTLQAENSQLKATLATQSPPTAGADLATLATLRQQLADLESRNRSLEVDAARVPGLETAIAEAEAAAAGLVDTAGRATALLQENASLAGQLGLANKRVMDLGSACKASGAEVARLSSRVVQLRARVSERAVGGSKAKKNPVRVRQEELVLVRSSQDRATLQVVKKNELKASSRSSSQTRSDG